MGFPRQGYWNALPFPPLDLPQPGIESAFPVSPALQADSSHCWTIWEAHIRTIFVLIHGPNIPGSYAILFFTALDFTFTTGHIHNWASFLLWPSYFILSGAISNCPLRFPSSILDTFQPGGLNFQGLIFLPFILFTRFSQQEYWSSLPFASSVDHMVNVKKRKKERKVLCVRKTVK